MHMFVLGEAKRKDGRCRLPRIAGLVALGGLPGEGATATAKVVTTAFTSVAPAGTKEGLVMRTPTLQAPGAFDQRNVHVPAGGGASTNTTNGTNATLPVVAAAEASGGGIPSWLWLLGLVLLALLLGACFMCSRGKYEKTKKTKKKKKTRAATLEADVEDSAMDGSFASQTSELAVQQPLIANEARSLSISAPPQQQSVAEATSAYARSAAPVQTFVGPS